MSWTVGKIHSQHGDGDKINIVCVLEGSEPLSNDEVLVRPEGGFEWEIEPRRRCPLSDREMDVLEKLAEGKVYKQIASEMHLAISTIRTHLHNIYGKLNVPDRAQAVLKAYQEGWIKIDLREKDDE